MTQTGFPSWSQTASSNSNADSTVNWAEGQAPSSINDSARAMMAALAKYRDDVSGSLTTAGTSTAFTITTNQVFASLADLDGKTITIVPHATSGASPTLAVDSLTAKGIKTATGVAVPTGALVEGTPYQLTYFNTAGEFILQGVQFGSTVGASIIPIGTIFAYPILTAPAGYLTCRGQAVSRTTYAALYAVLGTLYGTGDGSTTFNLPDIGGRVVAGIENAESRLTSAIAGVSGSVIGGAGGFQNKNILQANLPSVDFTVTIPSGQGSHTHALDDGASPLTNKVSSANGPNGIAGGASSISAATLPAMSGTAASGGSGTGLAIVQPTIVLNYIIFAGA